MDKRDVIFRLLIHGLRGNGNRLMGFYGRPGRRFYTKEMLDEEIVALVLAIGFTYGVMGTGYDNEFERLVGFDKCVGNLHGAGRVDIVIETVGVLDVGTFDVG